MVGGGQRLGSSTWPRDALGGTGDKGWDGVLQGHSPMGRMWCSGWNLKHGGRTAGTRPAGRLLMTATALRGTVHDGNRRNGDRIGEEMLVAVADCSLSVLIQ
jgi:hypothetical protein